MSDQLTLVGALVNDGRHVTFVMMKMIVMLYNKGDIIITIINNINVNINTMTTIAFIYHQSCHH